ncbi:dynein associated protein-domain-containing protein [Zopfochytrium polystomum]|nr:dynein associated protein-domain-containing protein [Zopfochytrium polystomum]
MGNGRGWSEDSEPQGKRKSTNMDVAVGTRVEVTSNNTLCAGTVRFTGPTSFAPGNWVGIELDVPNGKNDGSLQGTRYFECQPLHGVFVRASQIKSILPSTSSIPSSRSSDAGSETVTASSTARTSKPASSTAKPSAAKTLKGSISTPRSPNLGARATLPPSSATSASAKRISTAGSSSSSPSSPVVGSRVAKTKATALSVAKSQSSAPASPAFGSLPSPSPLRAIDSNPTSPTPTSQGAEEPDELGEVDSPPQELAEVDEEDVEDGDAGSGGATTPYRKPSIVPASRAVEESGIPTAFAAGSPYAPYARRESRVFVSVEVQVDADDFEEAKNDAAEAASLAREVEDLKTKLRLADQRRKDERDKGMDMEKLRQELDAAIIAKAAMNTKISDLQNELKDTRKMMTEAIDSKQVIEGQLHEAHEALEMMTLDKEMAEERAETLSTEMEALQDRIDELQIELEVLQEGGALDDEGTGEMSSSAKIQQLERQNDRLKEALVRLRDVTASQEAELKDKISSLERDNMNYIDQSNQAAQLEEKLLNAEAQIESLKASVDSMLGAEETVEYLSAQNLQLNEKIEELKASVEELEALNELNLEIEENHVLTERELQAEIDKKDAIIQRLKNRVIQQDESLGDYELTVQKFRDLVKTLQSDMEGLREASKESGATPSLNPTEKPAEIVAPVATRKTQGRALDIELRKLELQEALEHLDVVKNYLPDKFFREEYDSILCMLLVKRLLFKSTMIRTFLEQTTSAEAEPEERSHSAQLQARLVAISIVSVRFLGFMENSPPGWFGSMGKLLTDLQPIEKRLDALLQALKLDEPLPSDLMTELQRHKTQMEYIADRNIKYENISSIGVQNWATASVDSIATSINQLECELDRLPGCFNLTVDDSTLINSVNEIKTSYVGSFQEAKEAIRQFKIAVRKLRRRMDEIIDRKQTFKLDFVFELPELNKQVLKTVDYLAVLIAHISTHIQNEAEERLAPSVVILLQLSQIASESQLSSREDRPGTALAAFVSKLQERVEELQDRLNEQSTLERVVMKPPPWIDRSLTLKSEFLINTDMQRQIESLNDEVIVLVTEVNQKRQYYQEASVKIDLLERKLEGSRGQADKIANLESRVQRLMEKEREFAEAAEHLQEENRRLEQELTQQKRLSRRPEKYGSPSPAAKKLTPTMESTAKLENIFSEVSSTVVNPLPRSGGMDIQESIEMLMDGNIAAQFDSLRSALRYLRAENSRLKAQRLRDVSNVLFAPSDPLMRKHYSVAHSEPAESYYATSRVPGISQAQMTDLLRDSKALIRDVQEAGVSLKVVDVAKKGGSGKPAGARWSSLQTEPLFQFKSQVEKMNQLAKRGQNITERVKQFSAKMDDAEGGEKSKPLGRLPLLGRVQVPNLLISPTAPAPANNRVGMILTSRAEWEKIHSIFLK